MNSTPTNTKKKLNAIDWFIIAVLLLCIAGAAFRVFIGSDNSLSGAVTMEKHVVFFKVENIRNSSTEYLAPGAVFYIDSTGQYLGEISGNVTEERIPALRDLAVDYISSGALTHSATILDVSLKNLHPLP